MVLILQKPIFYKSVYLNCLVIKLVACRYFCFLTFCNNVCKILFNLTINLNSNSSYDADFNHSPCLRKGHTAHWALVCGVIVLEDPGDSYESKPDNVYVFSRHGKSRFLAAWDLEKLDKSNKNLWEFSPKKEADGLLYIFPEGGMGGENGLRNQFLIFEGL